MKKLLALLAIAVIAAIAYVGWQLRQPYKGFSEPVIVEFPHGTTTGQMAAKLSEEGVIRSPWVFLAARAFRRGAHLQAGE